MKKAVFAILFLASTMGLNFTFDHVQLYAQISLSAPPTGIAQPGAAVTIPLNLTVSAASSISAFGLIMIYPTNLLSFDTTLTAGTLTESWIQAGGRENTPGTVTIGGFHTTPITSAGVLINLAFNVKSTAAGCDTLKLRNFSDGLAGATTMDGVICAGAPAVVPIAIARQTANGVVVTIEGIVTRALGRFARLQDTTAGMVAFESAGNFRTAIDNGVVRRGDRVRLSGALAEFNQLKEMTPIHGFEVLSRDNPLPMAPVFTLKDIGQNGEQYESELIRVRGLRIDPAGDATFLADKTYQIRDETDNSNTVTLRIGRASDTKSAGRPLPVALFDFEGVLTQFHASDPAGGYQLQPVDTTDILLRTGAAEQPWLLPRQFALLPSYPNPFVRAASSSTLRGANFVTNIRYALPKAAHVKLVIYNLRGEKIRTLIEADETAGLKLVTWDATNDAGARVASGVYLYRLRAGDFTATRKLVFMQ